jgi:hypothetical protein
MLGLLRWSRKSTTVQATCGHQWNLPSSSFAAASPPVRDPVAVGSRDRARQRRVIDGKARGEGTPSCGSPPAVAALHHTYADRLVSDLEGLDGPTPSRADPADQGRSRGPRSTSASRDTTDDCAFSRRDRNALRMRYMSGRAQHHSWASWRPRPARPRRGRRRDVEEEQVRSHRAAKFRPASIRTLAIHR